MKIVENPEALKQVGVFPAALRVIPEGPRRENLINLLAGLL
jgi:hypothetical protein